MDATHLHDEARTAADDWGDDTPNGDNLAAPRQPAPPRNTATKPRRAGDLRRPARPWNATEAKPPARSRSSAEADTRQNKR